MPRKQFLAIKDEPEDTFDFHELFPVVNECPFSSLSPIDTFPLQFEQHEIKSEKVESSIPPLWFLEKLKLEDDQQDGMSDCSSNKSFGTLGASKEEMLSKLLPPKRVMPPAITERAEELKQQERIHHERFIEAILEKYPVDKSYHPNKARKYTNSDNDMDDEYKQPNIERRTLNDKSMESRYKKKVERTVNAYTIIHLRERILAYQTRMSVMKEMLMQNDILTFDDVSSDEYESTTTTSPTPSYASSDDTTTISSLSDFDPIESDIESISSISSYNSF